MPTSSCHPSNFRSSMPWVGIYRGKLSILVYRTDFIICFPKKQSFCFEFTSCFGYYTQICGKHLLPCKWNITIQICGCWSSYFNFCHLFNYISSKWTSRTGTVRGKLHWSDISWESSIKRSTGELCPVCTVSNVSKRIGQFEAKLFIEKNILLEITRTTFSSGLVRLPLLLSERVVVSGIWHRLFVVYIVFERYYSDCQTVRRRCSLATTIIKGATDSKQKYFAASASPF